MRSPRALLGAATAPERFRSLVLLTFVALYVNVCSGALVRVTKSGLGCPDWPLCNGRPTPPFAAHSIIEFSNRLLALTVIVVTILTAVSARRGLRQTAPEQWRLALAIAVGTLAQGPLGGVTILVGLHPVAVASHFLLAIVVFCLATILLIDVRLAPVVIDRPGWLRPATLAVTAWAFLLIVSGAIVTTSGTHPGAANVKRLWNLLDTAYWHVRIAVSFVVVLALFLFALARLDPVAGRLPRLAWAVVALTGTQIVIGELQWRNQLPWYLVLLHVATATALWAAVVALGRSLLSPRTIPTRDPTLRRGRVGSA